MENVRADEEAQETTPLLRRRNWFGARRKPDEARRAADANVALEKKPADGSQKLGTFSGVCGGWESKSMALILVLGMGSNNAECAEHFDVFAIRVPAWPGWSTGGTCATRDQVYNDPDLWA